MRRTPILLAALAVGLLLATGGCSSVKQTLGLTKQSPDEFKVVSRAPLSMPPDYNLRPPTPGAPRPQEGTPRDQAAAAVFQYSTTNGAVPADAIPPIGEGEAETAQSSGESALLQSAGASGVDPNIRRIVDAETAEDEADSRTLADTLTFWRDPEPYGEVVDAAAEQKRLQENAALGNPVTEGETPTIVRKKKGMLEGIF
ncbi:DUF3035 domain-containing protein [Dongia deserti]|uniref:DUF3035 domain-containing protein n=1 Tax=Dongia deserti TaxID=2268030 RepID=UPI000E6543CE|nr:DUF3035 domain-containing protein [Dongia deserti]